MTASTHRPSVHPVVAPTVRDQPSAEQVARILMWGGQSRGAGVVLAARPAYGVLPGSGRQFHGPLHWPVETSSASVSLLRMPSTPAVDRDVVAEAPRTVGCADEID